MTDAKVRNEASAGASWQPGFYLDRPQKVGNTISDQCQNKYTQRGTRTVSQQRAGQQHKQPTHPHETYSSCLHCHYVDDMAAISCFLDSMLSSPSFSVPSAPAKLRIFGWHPGKPKRIPNQCQTNDCQGIYAIPINTLAGIWDRWLFPGSLLAIFKLLTIISYISKINEYTCAILMKYTFLVNIQLKGIQNVIILYYSFVCFPVFWLRI